MNMHDDNMVVSLRPPKAAPVAAPAPVPPAMPPAPARAPRKGWRTRTWVALACAALIIFGTSAWFGYSAYVGGFGGSYVAQGASAATATDQKAEVAAIVAKVGRLIDLPQGETPTIATVSDLQKLQNEPFFAKAKQGDIVLIYTGAQEAYLYDPVQDKLVEVAPITTGQPQ